MARRRLTEGPPVSRAPHSSSLQEQSAGPPAAQVPLVVHASVVPVLDRRVWSVGDKVWLPHWSVWSVCSVWSVWSVWSDHTLVCLPVAALHGLCDGLDRLRPAGPLARRRRLPAGWYTLFRQACTHPSSSSLNSAAGGWPESRPSCSSRVPHRSSPHVRASVRRRADIQRCTTHSHAGTLTRGPAAGAIQGTRHLVALGAPGATCIQGTRRHLRLMHSSACCSHAARQLLRHLRLMHSFSKTGRPAGASEATS